LILLLFLQLGGREVFAQERFVLLNSQLLENEKTIIKDYLDVETVKSFVYSRFQEAWIKRTFLIKEPNLENEAILKNEKGEIDSEVSQTKSKKNINRKTSKNRTAYQLVHMQFDPINSKYKVLEVQSFGENGQAIVDLSKAKEKKNSSKENRISLKALDWTSLFPGTAEEAIGKALSDYIEKNTGRVKFY